MVNIYVKSILKELKRAAVATFAPATQKWRFWLLIYKNQNFIELLAIAIAGGENAARLDFRKYIIFIAVPAK